MQSKSQLEEAVNNVFYVAGKTLPTQVEMDKIVNEQRRQMRRLSLVVNATSILVTLAAGAVVGALLNGSILGTAGAFLVVRMALNYSPTEELRKGVESINRTVVGEALKKAPMDPEVEAIYKSMKQEAAERDRNMPQA